MRGRGWWCAVALLVAGCTPPNLPEPLPPLTTGSDPPPPLADGVISIGVDQDIRGFNPYVAGQFSATGLAVSAVVLPGVFPPGADAETRPTALVDRVTVSTAEPFTVTYELNQRAAWSDGTPIAAEDFSYLWQQMTSTDGVVGAGGYQLISDVRSFDAGKTVEVEFSTPYADWRTLFSPLLPARALKAEPGGFVGSLSTGIPVAGGPYRMTSYEPITGLVTLVRNDKYWSTGAAESTVVFRTGSAPDLVDALRRGDVQGLYFRPDGPAAAALADLPDVRTVAAPLPAVVVLRFLASTEDPLADPRLRSAVAAALDTGALRSILAGGHPPAALEPTSALALPADPATGQDTDPATDPAGSAEPLSDVLVDLGFRRTGLYWERAGSALTLTLAHLVGDERESEAARAVQGQLAALGLPVNLVALPAVDLQSALGGGEVDLVLATAPRTASSAAFAVSLLGCDPVSVPGTTDPVATGADSTAGEVSTDEMTALDPTGPGTTAPGTTAAESTPAGTTAPGAAAPTETPPTETGPDRTGPDRSVPDRTGPDTGPDTGEPDTGEPDGSGSAAPACADDVRDVLVSYLAGAPVAGEVRSLLADSVQVLPLAQPVAVLALGAGLADAPVPDVSARLLWAGPLQFLPEWPAPG